jgi:hypothetical protein
VPTLRQVQDDTRTPAERIINDAVDGTVGAGSPLDRRSMQYQRTLENYLKAGNRPRWMERLVEIDNGIAKERQRLQRVHRELAERHGAGTAAFARAWRERAATWDFGELNVLIQQHNEWYPIERQLPIDLRTRDYVLIRGRSYRRHELDADWILAQFPV